MLDNAIKYSPNGSCIRIVLRDGLQRATIEVIHSGVGIGRDFIERIFDRFYRIDKRRSRDLGGT